MTQTVLAQPVTKPRGRWQLVLLLMIVLAPMFLGTAMYKFKFWVPEGRVYHGALIGDGSTLRSLGVDGADTQKWQLVVTNSGECAQQCQQLVYQARQINISLNRDAARAGHALALSQPLEANEQARLRTQYPQLQYYHLDRSMYEQNHAAAQLWIVDPLGNLVLRYDVTTPGKQVLEDLRRLLKLSQIG